MVSKVYKKVYKAVYYENGEEIGELKLPSETAARNEKSICGNVKIYVAEIGEWEEITDE